jgi:membrane protease YdiL (CAAX protease family)
MSITSATRLWAIAVGYLVFAALSLWARAHAALFGAVVVVGIALPLAWGRGTGEWAAMGFTGRNVGRAGLWGMMAGAVSAIAGLAVLPSRSVPENVGRQLLIGLPLWLLVIGPFQEFLFRGWMQAGLEEVLGKWGALLVANACFVAWHYLSPIVDLADFPLTSVSGLLSTILAGLAYGYTFARSRSIIAPWLGHVIAGLAFILVGAMDFVQAMG